MKKFRKVVDERQELEMLKVEHWGFWAMFWMLFVSIIIQTGMGASFKQFGAEFIVFIIGCIITLILYLRKGLWDYYTKPCVKTYLLYSIIFSIIISILFGVINYAKIDSFKNNKQHLMISMGIFGVVIFAFIFIAMYLTGQYTIKKQKQLEKEYKD